MSSFSPPWVVGPVPVVVTIWAAYVTATALIHRREMTGGRFIAAFLFPLGLIAAISLIFLPRYDLGIVLIVGQVATAICFIATYVLEKTLRGDPPSMPTEESNLQNMLWTLYIAVIVYSIYYIFVFKGPIFGACSIAKCYILELLFGGKVYSFSVLYSVNFVGSLILVGVISILLKVILKMQTRD